MLWTWLTGLFGIATKYAESLIAVKYRRKTEDGTYLGGASVTETDWTQPWTYGIHPANRGQALWFESL